MTWQRQEVPGVAVLAAGPCWAGFALLRAAAKQAKDDLSTRRNAEPGKRLFLSVLDPAKSIRESYKAPVTQWVGQRCSVVGVFPQQVFSMF